MSENPENGGTHFASYFSLLRLVLKHARMAYHAGNETRSRLETIGQDEVLYKYKVEQALKLQEAQTIKFLSLMDKQIKGSEKFLLDSHKRFMKDIGKRNLVISRLNQDLDCVDIRDPSDPNQIQNSKKLKDMYKTLCKH